jgi:3-carboxy-cis,cis-muconate cycloisomerase
LTRAALTKNRWLLDLRCENAEIAQHMDRAGLAKPCDPANDLGLSGKLVDRVLARAVA